MLSAWKCFFNFPKYSSVTDMLIRLGLPSFSTISHNAEWTFMKQSSLCNNRLVSIVRDICMYDTKHVINTWSLILSLSVRFHLSTMCLSIFLYFLVLSIVICLCFYGPCRLSQNKWWWWWVRLTLTLTHKLPYWTLILILSFNPSLF